MRLPVLVRYVVLPACGQTNRPVETHTICPGFMSSWQQKTSANRWRGYRTLSPGSGAT